MITTTVPWLQECQHNWILYDLKLMSIMGECGLGLLAMTQEEFGELGERELWWDELWFCPDCRKVEYKRTPITREDA